MHLLKSFDERGREGRERGGGQAGLGWAEHHHLGRAPARARVIQEQARGPKGESRGATGKQGTRGVLSPKAGSSRPIISFSFPEDPMRFLLGN